MNRRDRTRQAVGGIAQTGSAISRRCVLAAGPAAVGLGFALTAESSTAAAASEHTSWRGAWGRALVRNPNGETLAAGTTYRERLRSSLAGQQVRIVISNELGDSALSIAAATVRAGQAVATDQVRFGGLPSIVVPAGASVVTDPILHPVQAGEEVEVSLFFDEPVDATTIDRRAQALGALVAPGNQASATSLSEAVDIAPLFVKTLEVAGSGDRQVLVVLSDTKSAGPETWTPMLAERASGRFGVVNRSVYAGHLALGPAHASALARFDREVLATSGATHVLIFTGNNDLIQPGMMNAQGQYSLDPSLTLSVDQITSLLAQAVARTRAAGLVAIGGTWLAYEGVTISEGYSSPEKMAKRELVNQWIRAPGSFDAIVDFDAALRDPSRPVRLRPEFDQGNHFTPNESGYASMAELALQTMLSV